MKRFNFNWEKFAQNRFNHLLIIFIVLFVVTPFIQAKEGLGFRPAVALIYTLSVVAILKTIITNKKKFYILCSVKLLTFLFDALLFFEVVTFFKSGIHAISLIINIAFFVFFILHLIRELFSTQRVTSDTIKGGICVYMLLGFLWAILFFI